MIVVTVAIAVVAVALVFELDDDIVNDVLL
jgi:hypothetical protein